MRIARRTAPSVSPVKAYELLSADTLLENGVRGWDETFVCANPSSEFVHHRRHDGDCFSRLSDWFSTLPTEADEKTAVGAYGFAGYDVVKEYEDVETYVDEDDVTERDMNVPDGFFRFYDTVAVVREDETVVEAVEHDGQDAPSEDRAENFVKLLNSDVKRELSSVVTSEVRSNFEREEYEEAVRLVKEYVREGDTFQANISQRLSFESDAEPIDLYARLRETNPSPYMGLIEGDGWAVVSSSPELLVRAEGDALTTRPIAGTRPRAKEDETVDNQLRDELRASEKERAEHAILVDLARNDLGKVAEYGTVDVDRFAEVVPYSEVQHLESVVTAERRDGATALDALGAVFPGGTVTGAPKPRTLGIIEELEPTERGPYTGTMGRVSLNGDATFNILIRTAVRDGKTYHLQVGGGVVHDSVPEDEYEETLQKAEGVLNALETKDGDAG